MEKRSPAQVYAVVVGAALVLAGIAGFFYNASFAAGDGTERKLMAAYAPITKRGGPG